MKEVALFSLQGLGTGALFAGFALALVLMYRGSGVINIATGAVAMLCAYAFWAFKTGEFGPELGTPIALVLTFMVALAIGILMDVSTFRPLRGATPLAKLVASLGLLLLAQASMILAFGSDPKPVPSILPSQTFDLFGLTVPVNRPMLAGIVILITIVLWAVYRWTKFGLATRAASENEVSSMLAGLSPDRLSLTNTVLAAVVAGSLGVLAAPVTQLNPTTLPLQVVPALAAALFARFTSFGIACVAGLAIGAAENVVYYASTQPWFPSDGGVPLPGVQQLLVLVIIVVAMYWRGASLPSRGELVERRLPAVPKAQNLLKPALILGALCAVALVVFPFDFRQALINTLIAVALILSLVVITGYVGQISVVQLALSGASGFVIAHLGLRAGIEFPVAAIIGALAATALGVLIALSSARVRGVSLAVVTLAAAVAIENFWFVNSTFGGGSRGTRVSPPEIFGLELGPQAPFRGLDGSVPSPMLGFMVLIGTVLLCLLVANLRRNNFGHRMLAVRSNERAAAAAGIDVRNTKLAGFALSAFIAGIAGAMYAYNFGSISANRFDALTALSLIAFAYLGGITMVSGAIVAALLTTEALMPHALQSWFGISGTWTLVFAGVALISHLILFPEGIAGGMRAQFREMRQKPPIRWLASLRPWPERSAAPPKEGG